MVCLLTLSTGSLICQKGKKDIKGPFKCLLKIRNIKFRTEMVFGLFIKLGVVEPLEDEMVQFHVGLSIVFGCFGK